MAGRWHLCRKTKVPLLAAGAAARVDGVLFSAGRRGATPGPGAFVPCTGHTVSLWDFHPADAWHEPAQLHVHRARGAPQGRGALGPPSRHSFPVPAPALLWRRPMGIRSPGKPRPVILRWPVAQSHENAVVPKGFELISLQRCHVRTDGVHRSGAAPRDLHCPSQSACWGEVGAYPARTAPAVPWALSRCKRWLRQKILSTLQE